VKKRKKSQTEEKAVRETKQNRPPLPTLAQGLDPPLIWVGISGAL